MSEAPDPEVRRLAVGPFQSNCYLVRAPAAPREPAGTDEGAARTEAVVVDPGAEARRIEAALEEWSAEPAAILLTHAHADHVGAVAAIEERYGCPVWLHPADRSLYDRAPEQAAAFGIRLPAPPPPDHELAHGDVVRAAGLSFGVRHAPGHSPGGVVLVAGPCAFVGDCVFAGSIGRTDLPGGDARTLLRSIREQILTLPEDTILYSGHGPETTVAREAATNPFLTGAFGWSG